MIFHTDFFFAYNLFQNKNNFFLKNQLKLTIVSFEVEIIFGASCILMNYTYGLVYSNVRVSQPCNARLRIVGTLAYRHLLRPAKNLFSL